VALDGFSTGIGHLAAATPPSRDRYVDFIRAFSIVTVVLGHYLIALIHWEGGRIFVHNVVGHQSGLWLATWLLQVMPLFFFVGGFSNAVGWKSTQARGGRVADFARRRLERLMRPTAAFVVVWLVIEVVLRLVDRGASGVLRSTFLPFGPMWFLFVYVFVIVLAPATIAAHDRFGWRVPALLAALVAIIDLLRFGFDVAGIGWLNLAFVWLAVHQMGYFYADGSLVNAGKRAWLVMIGCGLAVLIVLTNLELFMSDLYYPRSMVGVDIEPVSNMSPPSLAIVALAVWQIGLAMWVREPVTGWLQRPGPWKATIAVNAVIMTLFLWHLTALLITILLLYPHGLGNEIEPTLRWWIERPVWVLGPLVVLAPILAVFRRFERVRN
jgi:fucose 4-O-acetylase-like acetyltransferase